MNQPTIEDLTMNKSELIESLAAKKSLTFKKAEK
jgi:nucleoid DNA-binding protein